MTSIKFTKNTNILYTNLLRSSRHLTKMGSISLLINSSIGGFLSDESNFLADCIALSWTSELELPASSTKEFRSYSDKGFSKCAKSSEN